MGPIDKLKSILSGWKNLFVTDETVEVTARLRAIECAKCEHAKPEWYAEIINDKAENIHGLVCKKCDCPLSAKLRSKAENCPENKW